MMARVGVEVEIAHGDVLGLRPSEKEYEIALYAWVPPLLPPRARRHIEIIVDGDIPPTGDCERVYPSEAWRNYMWARHHHGITAPQRPESYGHVIPNWVDPELWPLSTEEDDYFLFVGRLQPLKLGVLPELVKAFPDRKFKIAGEGNRSLIPALGNVEFVGHLEQRELAAMMGRARAVLCPSQYCEPFGLAAVEAGLTGALVIASDVGAFHETIPATSMLVNPYSLREWVAALETCEHPSAQHDRLLRRGWHDARHSPATIGLRFRAVLEGRRGLSFPLTKGVYACG